MERIRSSFINGMCLFLFETISHLLENPVVNQVWNSMGSSFNIYIYLLLLNEALASSRFFIQFEMLKIYFFDLLFGKPSRVSNKLTMPNQT